MLLEICASLISLLDNSTPSISSPCTEDFPSLDLKKPSSLDLKLFFEPVESFGDLIPGIFGFFILKSFNFPNIFVSLLLT